MEQGNFTYILECSDGSFYTGWTKKLVYFESFSTKQEAMRREWEIKQLKRQQKEKMIMKFQQKEDKKTGEGGK